MTENIAKRALFFAFVTLLISACFNRPDDLESTISTTPKILEWEIAFRQRWWVQNLALVHSLAAPLIIL